MTAADEPIWPNAWVCGGCGEVTDVAHWYEDRATRTMQHCADDVRRGVLARQCGARFDDSYGPPTRCDEQHGHSGPHRNRHVRWRDTDLGNRPPPPPIADGANA